MTTFCIPTLKNRCIGVLAENMEDLLIVLNADNNHELKEYMRKNYSNLLFQRMKNDMKEEHAKFFISQHLTRLDFHKFSLTHIPAILPVLRDQGSGILSFCLLNFKKYPEAILLELARSLPSTLTSLQLLTSDRLNRSVAASIPAISSKVLKIVPKTCPNLQQLHLSDCWTVTDDGMEALFRNPDNIQNTVLQVLDLSFTSVTKHGILLALECCPNMIELIHHDVQGAIDLAYENRVLPVKTYKLQALQISPAFLTQCHIMCPHVKTLSVMCITTQAELNICGNFKELRDVHLYTSKSILLSPFFKTGRSNLELLTIEGKFIISIDSLIKFCPNLKFIKIVQSEFENFVADGALKYSLQNLRTLKIRLADLATTKREVTHLIHSSPNLETIVLTEVSGFTDAVVELIAMHISTHLRNFSFNHCDIDAAGIKHIILAAPQLTYMHINKCENISREQCKDLEQLRDGLTIDYSRKICHV